MSNELTVTAIATSLMADLTSNGIEELLPKGISIETFSKLAAVAIFNNPQLREADTKSVINSLILSAKDGLLCDGREAALVPFKTKGVMKAQYIPMVDGVLKRVRQSGQVSVIASKPVFENDEFTFYTDEDGDHFKHIPTLAEPGPLIAVIAYAKMKDGTRHIELLRRWEIDRVRSESKQGNNDYGPWAKWFDRMACKTGLHRIGRRLPNSSEILEMIERGSPMNFDERQERDVTPQKTTGNDAIDLVMNDEPIIQNSFGELSDLIDDLDDLAMTEGMKNDIRLDYEAGKVDGAQAQTLLDKLTAKREELKAKEINNFDFKEK